MPKPITSILIVGGGTSGWMTAAFLSRFLQGTNCSISLVESSTLGTIGVGEATVPPMVALLRMLGIDEREFLRECHATYKLGIKFIDWRRDSRGLATEAWHPFGPVGAPQIEHLPLFHHWLRETLAGREIGSYASYSLQAMAGDMQRAPRSMERDSVITRNGTYAYHLDARAFADYLARHAMRTGVRRVVDDVLHATLDERGRIHSLSTRHSGPLSADLYVDCSGFSGLLIERELGDPWIDWSDRLFCDRAAIMPLPADDGAMAPYTKATALSSGWVWRIPLSHRVGCGYVYSSRYASDDEAARELVAYAGLPPSASPAGLLRMKVGRRQRFWISNCVAIGLAAGFLEPLESTGIFLAQKGVELLLDYMPDGDFEPALAARYNARMSDEFEQVRDFIILHYLLNGREGPFWRDNRHAKPPASLAEALALYDSTGLVDWEANSLFRDTSFYAIAAGFGRLPRRPHAMADQRPTESSRNALAEIRERNLSLARDLPGHAEFMRSVQS